MMCICSLVYSSGAFAQQRPPAPPVHGDSNASVMLIQDGYLPCTVNVPNFNIVIGNLAKVPPLTFNIGVNCNTMQMYKYDFWALKPGWDLVYCYHIHGQATVANHSERFTGPGPAQPATATQPYIAPRTISFRLFAPDKGVAGGNSMVVGTAGGVPYDITGYLDPAVRDVTYGFTSPVTLVFADDNDTTIPYPPGSYTYGPANIHFVMAQLNPAAPFTYPNACGSNSDLAGTPNRTLSFSMSFTVKTYCNVNVKKNLDFGLEPSLHQSLKTDGLINVDCSAGTEYKLTIPHGSNYDGSSDYMKRISDNESDDTSSKVRYIMDYPTNEGCQGNVCTGLGSGLPAGIDYPISAEVPQQPTPPDGKYRDTIVVTLVRTSVY